MQSHTLQTILDARFRANPAYEITLFDRLPPSEQALLGDLQRDPEFYGVLRPRWEGRLGVKSLDRATALLLFSLQQPGPLPMYVRSILGDACNATVAQLVLDHVLQIEHDGDFVSGADAYPLIYLEPSAGTGQGRIGRLSIEAVQYAQRLEIDDALKLSARMYFYNRVPASPSWQRRFPSAAAVADYLELESGMAHRRILDRAWTAVALPPPQDGWLMWRSRPRRPRQSRQAPTFKLYVSPACESLRDAFRAVLDVFSAQQVPTFKIGKDLAGLLRPDKIVAYFDRFADLQAVADELATAINGLPAHGVPFSAELAGDGLLSWGMDPPRDQHHVSWLERESWRLWVTNRLAVALIAAKERRSTLLEPWQFAIERLRLEDVDVITWTPAMNIWQDHSAAEG